MRTHEKPKSFSKHKASLLRPSYERRRMSHRLGAPGANEAEEQASRTLLAGLVQEHRDLDSAIAVLLEAGACDPLLIARMKKRKLQLKDEISRFDG